MKDPLSRTKVVVRRLPPSLSQSDLLHQIDDRFSGRYSWFSFRPGKNSQKHQRYSRAYIDFNRPEDVLEFAEFFDGHVFVNEKGVRHKALVEYAPSQRVPKPSSRKDGRDGTMYKDPDYLEFLKLIAKPVEHLPSAEIQLERKEAEQAGAPKEALIVTPLMEYVRQKRSVGSGAQGSLVVGKISRRSGTTSSRKSGSSNAKRASEKKKYILKEKIKNISRKDKSTFIVVPKREDQLATSSGKEASETEIVSAIEGSVSGIPVLADSGKKKILLLKGKRPETPVSTGMSQQQDTSLGNSAVSAAPKQNQRREAGGKLIRSILLNNEARQTQASAPGQHQQKVQILNSENVKRLPRSSNARSGLNGHVSHNDPEGDRRKDPDDKFTKKDLHNMSTLSEKPEKRTRNKDRPDRGVWAPLRRGDVPHSSEERISSLIFQSPQSLTETVEGSHRNFGRRGTAHNMKDEGPQNVSEGKSSKRGASVHGANEKQVWVQKSSADDGIHSELQFLECQGIVSLCGLHPQTSWQHLRCTSCTLHCRHRVKGEKCKKTVFITPNIRPGYACGLVVYEALLCGGRQGAAKCSFGEVQDDVSEGQDDKSLRERFYNFSANDL